MNIHGARRAGRRRRKACMGWSWAAACGVQGRGHIARLLAQLVLFGLGRRSNCGGHSEVHTVTESRHVTDLPAPCQHNRRSITVMLVHQLNIRSLLNKFDDVVELCRDRHVDLLCLTESSWHIAPMSKRLRNTVNFSTPGIRSSF